MIEVLHCMEVIAELLDDPDILAGELMAAGAHRHSGVGVIEAPRGTLIHHYEVGDDDLVTMCNLIVSTTHNNQAMNEAVRAVAREYLDGKELTEGLLNHIEVAIRAYDPCLSCATHALGQMPLQVTLLGADGELLDRVLKSSQGEFLHHGRGAGRQPHDARRLLVFGWGNRSRGDDALGPLCVERLRALSRRRRRGRVPRRLPADDRARARPGGPPPGAVRRRQPECARALRGRRRCSRRAMPA